VIDLFERDVVCLDQLAECAGRRRNRIVGLNRDDVDITVIQDDRVSSGSADIYSDDQRVVPTPVRPVQRLEHRQSLVQTAIFSLLPAGIACIAAAAMRISPRVPPKGSLKPQ
jgi:hypothetical protein